MVSSAYLDWLFNSCWLSFSISSAHFLKLLWSNMQKVLRLSLVSTTHCLLLPYGWFGVWFSWWWLSPSNIIWNFSECEIHALSPAFPISFNLSMWSSIFYCCSSLRLWGCLVHSRCFLAQSSGSTIVITAPRRSWDLESMEMLQCSNSKATWAGGVLCSELAMKYYSACFNSQLQPIPKYMRKRFIKRMYHTHIPSCSSDSSHFLNSGPIMSLC